MLESFNTGGYEYIKLSPEEQEKRGIKGRLVGMIADTNNPTRNGRRYSKNLWDKVFNDPIFKEKLENRQLFGELAHPKDRLETDPEKIAVCLAEMPKIGADGMIYGIFDILDTPCGRILKTMCDYGCNMGISSRGEGDLITGYDGVQEVDPDTYTCECFDIVSIPAVKSARLKYVTESLDNKKLKQALKEDIDRAKDKDKKIMNEVLSDLDLETLDNESKGKKILIEDPVDTAKLDKDWSEEEIKEALEMLKKSGFPTYKEFCEKLEEVEKEKTMAVENNEAIVEELRNQVKVSSNLNHKIANLQEQLSVCYAKEEKLNEDINKYKENIFKLSEESKKAKAFESKSKSLNEKYESLIEQNKSLQARIKDITTVLDKSNSKNKTLEESLDTRVNQQEDLVREIKTLKESLDSAKAALKKSKSLMNESKQSIDLASDKNKQLNKEIKKLKEELAQKSEKSSNEINKLNEDLSAMKTDYSVKLENSNKLLEKYKKATSAAVDKYIELQAVRLGSSSNEIKNRLPESYNFKDIDRICEDLLNYNVNLSKLPYTIKTNKKINESLKIKTSEPIKTVTATGFDDTIDEDLLYLAGK